MNRVVLFLSVCCLGFVCVAHGVTNKWSESEGGLWTNILNWSEGIPPGSGDIADLSVATGTIALTKDVTVGEILYNPVPLEGATNTLTILSDTAAPASRRIIFSTATTNHLQVGAGAELWADADLLSNGNLLKDGYGTLVIKRRLYATFDTPRYEYWIEQGRVVNEGAVIVPSVRMCLGSVEPDPGAAPELVLREGSSYLASRFTEHSDVWLGCNRFGWDAVGSRAVVTHEGGVLNMTTNATNGVFLNGHAAGGKSVYNLAGGEVDLSGKKAHISVYGDGTVNQSGGKLKVREIDMSRGGARALTTSQEVSCGWAVLLMEGAEQPLSKLAERVFIRLAAVSTFMTTPAPS